MKATKLNTILSITFSLLFLLSLSACSKKSDSETNADDSKYYFMATLNGKKINFFDANFQGGGNDGKWEHIVIGGDEDKTSNSPSLDIELWMTGGNIKTGTYDFNLNRNFISRYAIQEANNTIIYNTEYDGVRDYKINITELSKDGIRGTFSGTLKLKGSTKVYIVTDGDFYLPYQKIINSSH
jgi:hypothetical protein